MFVKVVSPAFVGLLVLGIIYWIEPVAVSRCVLHSQTCSLTIATWFLVFFGLTAFFAAAIAANYAKRAYDLESSCSMAQSRCTDLTHRKSPDKVIYIVPVRDSIILTPSPPSRYKANPKEWKFQHLAFVNLGRSPIFRVSVKCEVAMPTYKKTETVNLGSIGSDSGEIHVKVVWPSSLRQIEINWPEDGATHQPNGKAISLKFMPEISDRFATVALVAYED